MARKNGLNRKEQILCAKWIGEGVSKDAIAKKLGVTVAIVNKFTPEKLKAADDAAKERQQMYVKRQQENRDKAAVLTAALTDQGADLDFQ